MLVLTRRKGESIIVGEDIEIKILEVEGGNVRIGINAPRQTAVFRRELLEVVAAENLRAVSNASRLTGELAKLVPEKELK